jgi:hypothetical protein
MKRLRDVEPGDYYVGRGNWQHLTTVRKITNVRPSHKSPGKLVFEYELDGMTTRRGKMRRWPNFYVICIKPE